MLNRSSTHQELLQLSQKRRSQPTHLRLIFLTVLLSIFHLNTSRQNTKQSLRLSPCVTDWRQRVARWSIYFHLTRANTIQYRWHRWYYRKHYTFTDQLAQVVLAQALYIYRPAGTSGTSYRRRLLAPPCRPDFPRRRAPEQLS